MRLKIGRLALCLVLGVAAGAGVARAGGFSVTDSVGPTSALNALNVDAHVDVTGNLGCGFSLGAGTLAGTLTPEISFDGVTWSATKFSDITGTQTSTLVLTNPNSATSLQVVTLGGTRKVRVRVSSYTSGSASGFMVATLTQLQATGSGGGGGGGTVTQGPTGTNAAAWWAQIGDTNNGPVAVKAASTAVGASDVSFAVGLSPNSPLPAGSSSLGTVGLNTGTNSVGTVGLNSGSNTVGSINNISGTVSLPTGAATQATLATASSTLTTISGQLPTSLGAKTTANSTAVNIASDQTVAVNQTQVGGVTVSTGNGVVGTGVQRVAVASDNTPIPTKPGDGTNNITVKAASTAAVATDTAQVVTLSPNQPQLTTPLNVTTTTANNTTGTNSQVASSATSVTCLAANSNRVSMALFNASTQIVYLKPGTTASTTSYTLQIPAGGYWEMPPNWRYTGKFDCIWTSANGFAYLTEITP